MTNATATPLAEEIQSSEDWNAWFFERQDGYLQVAEDWYAWNFERAPIQTEIQAEQGTIVLSANTLYSITGIEAESEIGTVNAQIDETELVAGQELTSEIEEVTAQASASITLSGIEAISELGTVTASATGEMVMVPGRISYKKPRKNASVTIIGVDLPSELGEILASGTIIINNVVKIHSIEARLQAKAVQAEGVLNLTDDEIILLMAA
jgi:hypothetical protein